MYLHHVLWLLATAASAASLALPPGEAPAPWSDALALARLDACVGSQGCTVTTRVDGGAWVLRVAGTGREARVAAPTTARGREDVALLAASLLRSGPTVALPVATMRDDDSSSSWGGGASPPATPPRAPGGPVVASTQAPGAARVGTTGSGGAVPVRSAAVPVSGEGSGGAVPVRRATVPTSGADVRAAPTGSEGDAAVAVSTTGSTDGPPWLAEAPPAAGRPAPAPDDPVDPDPDDAAESLDDPDELDDLHDLDDPDAPDALDDLAARDPGDAALVAPRTSRFAAFAGVNVQGRAGLALAPGARVGGALRVAAPGPAVEVVVAVGGALPAAPTLGVGTLGSVSGAVAIEVRGEGRLGPFAALGPSLTAFVFDVGEAQVGVTPGLVGRAGAGWPITEAVRIELAFEGGVDQRGIVLGRGGEVEARVGAPWAGGGVFLRFR